MPHQDDFQPTEQRRLTRAKTVEATIALLARDGFSRTRWRRVAEEAGVTGGVLQYHFGDKATLLAAVLEHLCEEQASALREAAAPIVGGSLRARVEAFVEVAFDLMDGPREVALLELLIGLRDESKPAISSSVRRVMMRTYDDLWHQLFHDVSVSEAQLVGAEHLLFSALHGFAVHRLFGHRLRFDEARGALIDAIVCLLGGDP